MSLPEQALPEGPGAMSGRPCRQTSSLPVPEVGHLQSKDCRASRGVVRLFTARLPQQPAMASQVASRSAEAARISGNAVRPRRRRNGGRCASAALKMAAVDYPGHFRLMFRKDLVDRSDSRLTGAPDPAGQIPHCSLTVECPIASGEPRSGQVDSPVSIIHTVIARAEIPPRPRRGTATSRTCACTRD